MITSSRVRIALPRMLYLVHEIQVSCVHCVEYLKLLCYNFSGELTYELNDKLIGEKISRLD